MITPRVVTILSCNVNAAGTAPSSKSFFSLAKSQRVNLQSEFVDKVILQEEVDDLTAAPHLNVKAF